MARDRLGTWVQVELPGTGISGWVSGAERYVLCTAPIADLPVGVIPPTPTATVTPTPLPTATPTATEAVVQVPQPPTEIGIGGGGGGGLDGEIRADIALVADPNGRPTFRDRFYLRMLVRDPDEGGRDGAGIDYVEFFVVEGFWRISTGSVTGARIRPATVSLAVVSRYAMS